MATFRWVRKSRSRNGSLHNRSKENLNGQIQGAGEMTITLTIAPAVNMGAAKSCGVTVDALAAQAGEMAFAAALVEAVQKFAVDHLNQEQAE